MAIKNAGDIALKHIGDAEDFVSPFPSNEAMINDQLQAVFGASAPGTVTTTRGEVMAAMRLSSVWMDAIQMSAKRKATSGQTGGIRSDWWSQIVKDKAGADWGMFSYVNLPSQASPAAILSSIGEAGLEFAVDFVSEIPIVGQIIGAVAATAQFLTAILKKPPEQRPALVPLNIYSKDSDEEMAKQIIAIDMDNVDWMNMFMPPFESNVFWTLKEAEDPTSVGRDQHGWVYAPFSGGDPDYTGAIGFMPGTQRMANSMQLLDNDNDNTTPFDENLVNVGNFFPATAQISTAAWEQVQRFGSPDMFTVRTDELIDAWEAYFAAFFESGKSLWNTAAANLDQAKQIRISRATQEYISFPSGGGVQLGVHYLANMIWWPGMLDCPGGKNCEYNVSPDYGPVPPGYRHGNCADFSTCWPTLGMRDNKFSTVFDGLIRPALITLKERQWSALFKTVVCAYVRPQPIGSQLAHSAFRGGGRAAQLRQRCIEARELLLQDSARFSVRLADVRDIDRPYADRLEAAGVTLTSWISATGVILARPPLIIYPLVPGDTSPTPEGTGPQGGAPFTLAPRPVGDGESASSKASPLVKIGVAGGAAYGLYRLLNR